MKLVIIFGACHQNDHDQFIGLGQVSRKLSHLFKAAISQQIC